MIEEFARFQALKDDDELWVLVWLGPLFIDQRAPSQYSVFGFISPLRYSTRRSPAQFNKGAFPRQRQFDLDRVRRVVFSAGDLAALHLGMTFRNRRLIVPRKPLLREATFPLDFSQQESALLNELPTEISEKLLIGNYWTHTEHSAVVRLHTRSGVSVLIPIPEVWRQSYGTSSRLLQATLSGELESALKEIMQTGVLVNSTYSMTLPPQFPETDAPTLAWLALDPQARETATRVNVQLTVSASSEAQPNFRFPKSRLPYQGARKLTALGRWLGPETFLVCRIVHVGFTAPFERVLLPPLESSPDEHGTDHTLEPRHLQGRKRPGRTARLHSGQEPRDVRAFTSLPALSAQFSHVTAIDHLPGPAAPGQNRPVVTHPTPAGRDFTSGLESDASSSLNRAILTNEAGDAPAESPLRLREFDDLRKVLGLLRDAEYTVTELMVNNPGGSEGRWKDWRDGQLQRVGCLVAELFIHGQWSFILEKERLGSAYGPLILAQRQGRQQANEAMLSLLMDERAKRRCWPRTVPGWTLWHIPHNFTSPLSFAQGLIRRIVQSQGDGGTGL